MGVSLNKSSIDELKKVPGIGENLAEELIRYRDLQGGIKDWKELEFLPGFTPKLIEEIKREGASL